MPRTSRRTSSKNSRAKKREKGTAKISPRITPSPAEDPLVVRLRDELAWLRREYELMRTKCERLELAVMSQYKGAGTSYVARTDYAETTETKTTTPQEPRRLTLAELRDRWENLSEKEQEEHITKGDWAPETEEVQAS